MRALTTTVEALKLLILRSGGQGSNLQRNPRAKRAADSTAREPRSLYPLGNNVVRKEHRKALKTTLQKCKIQNDLGGDATRIFCAALESVSTSLAKGAISLKGSPGKVVRES